MTFRYNMHELFDLSNFDIYKEDKESKEIRFDMVISFDSPDRGELYNHVIRDLKREFPDYEISAGMDMDFNEI